MKEGYEGERLPLGRSCEEVEEEGEVKFYQVAGEVSTNEMTQVIKGSVILLTMGIYRIFLRNS